MSLLKCCTLFAQYYQVLYWLKVMCHTNKYTVELINTRLLTIKYLLPRNFSLRVAYCDTCSLVGVSLGVAYCVTRSLVGVSLGVAFCVTRSLVGVSLGVAYCVTCSLVGMLLGVAYSRTSSTQNFHVNSILC